MERTEQENIYRFLEFSFETIDSYKAELLKDKDNEDAIAVDKQMIKYFTDISNNILIKTEGGV